MGKDKSAKGKKKPRKIQDLPAKGKWATAMKGGTMPRLGFTQGCSGTDQSASTTQPDPNYTTAAGCKVYVP